MSLEMIDWASEQTNEDASPARSAEKVKERVVRVNKQADEQNIWKPDILFLIIENHWKYKTEEELMASS